MLLREFKIDENTIILNQDENTYVAQVINNHGEKIFYHEYSEYDKIKASFDEIVQNIQQGNIDIKNILDILEKSTI
ncbi:MAG: hypothetical protein A2Y23_02525 [Clostridiales bacterium GWB2_37_7]|nr:MAG: hypothetical protein A2Y23_02525 [Clostridiales bacterium GWB2_37_7]